MTPVEATKTCSGLIPRASAAVAAMARASAIPRSPLQALAFPLLATIARMGPEPRCCRERRTGAAATLLVVNTAAPAAGTSLKITARSNPCALSPQWTPAARKPLAAVTPPSIGLIATLTTPFQLIQECCDLYG